MNITRILVMLGFGIPGLLILIFAGLFARSRTAVVFCGVVASLFMAFQCIALFAMITAGQAWTGSDGAGTTPGLLAVGFAVAVVVYFALALGRIGKDHANADSPARLNKEGGLLRRFRAFL